MTTNWTPCLMFSVHCSQMLWTACKLTTWSWKNSSISTWWTMLRVSQIWLSWQSILLSRWVSFCFFCFQQFQHCLVKNYIQLIKDKKDFFCTCFPHKWRNLHWYSLVGLGKMSFIFDFLYPLFISEVFSSL